MPYHTFWTENWGAPLCKQGLSRNLLRKILRFLCFDKKSYRSQRLNRQTYSFLSCVKEVHR